MISGGIHHITPGRSLTGCQIGILYSDSPWASVPRRPSHLGPLPSEPALVDERPEEVVAGVALHSPYCEYFCKPFGSDNRFLREICIPYVRSSVLRRVALRGSRIALPLRGIRTKRVRVVVPVKHCVSWSLTGVVNSKENQAMTVGKLGQGCPQLVSLTPRWHAKSSICYKVCGTEIAVERSITYVQKSNGLNRDER